MQETPEQWEGRNKRQFLKSTKDTLGGEMWFAVKLNVGGTFLFMIGILFGVGFDTRWSYAFMGATFLAFGVSLYWAWYIRRGINRRWEKELAAKALSSKREETKVLRPPEDLLSKDRVQGSIEQRPDGPQRRFGG
jgi:hypothetical protein